MSEDIFAPMRKKSANWSSVATAFGDYANFAKFDYPQASKKLTNPKITIDLGANSQEINPEIEVIAKTFSSLNASEIALAKKYLLTTPNLDFKSDLPLAFHAAHANDGVFISIPDGASADVSIRIDATSHSCSHSVIALGKGANANILFESSSSRSEPLLHTELSEAFLGEDSSLCLTNIQNNKAGDWSFNHHFNSIKKFAKLKHAIASFGSSSSRTRAYTHLLGERAACESYQLFLGDKDQLMDTESCNHHHVPSTSGFMTCQGALDGKSTGVYKGMIKIDRAAANTQSFQSGSSFLLSESAKANVIPSLEVNNFDVEASHGASVGSPDANELIYLRARGLEESTARNLLLQGYFEKIISKLDDAAARNRLAFMVEKYLSSLKPAISAKHAPAQAFQTPGLEARASIKHNDY